MNTENNIVLKGLVRLVMLYTFSNGVDCWNRIYPVLAESPEAALVSFEEAYAAAKKAGAPFMFAGTKFWAGDFEEEGAYFAPDFLTLDEWFLRAVAV